MQILVTARGMDMTKALHEYAENKVSKLTEFFNNIQKIEVILEAHKIDNTDKRQMAEIRAWLAGLKVIQAKEAAKDMYAAIDLVLDEAKRQIQKHKRKHNEELRRKSEKAKKEMQNKFLTAD